MRCLPAILAVLAFILAAPAAAQPVRIDGGDIDGIQLSDGVKAWLGVPFAAPPVRDLRWKPPQPVTPWSGVYHADRFAPECLQPLRGSTQNHYFGNEATSEDCLYLNIWAPQSGQKLPVIVWIYGGGFNIGSASMANYSGEPLARAGVVRVNFAYRVGPLGFMAHPDLTRESGYGGSGNYGLMDLIAGLQWVKRNIARFGGDPDNVTIVGQSAGSMAVANLQLSPLAKGLFARAVGMSGSPFGGMLGPIPLDRAEAQGAAFQDEMGAASLAELRAMPGDKIIAARTRRDAIVDDGYVLTGNAIQIFARGGQNDVPILIGYTRDENFLPLGTVKTVGDLTAAVRKHFGDAADRILAAYQLPGLDPARVAADIARDATLGKQMSDWAIHQHRYGRQPAYAYFFTRRQPYAPGITFSDHDPATAGAYHSGDIPYWLRTRDSLNLFRLTRIWEAGDASLETTMSSALLAFSRGQTPSSPGLGDWPAFDPAAPRLIWLDTESRVADWPHFTDMPLFVRPVPVERPQSARPRD